jgi:hypothetical protein
MKIRSEKQLREAYKDQLAPESVDALVKAERAAGRLKDESDEDDDDAAEWDAAGEALAKARREADDLAKAELNLNIHTAVDQPGTTASPSPTERPASGRKPVPTDDFEDLSPDEIFQDLTKAVGSAMDPRLDVLAKAFTASLQKAVAHIEKRIAPLQTLLNASLGQNEVIAKATRKQNKRFADLQKALDNSPAARNPRYSVHDVKVAPHPGDPRTPSADPLDGLEDWIVGKVSELSKAGGSTSESRLTTERYQQALQDLDSGERTPAQIAKDLNFPTNRT